MRRTQIYLTPKEHELLKSISDQTGKTKSSIIREAVDQYIARYETQDRNELLKSARGIWKNREDIPDVEKLRKEFERMAGSGEQQKNG